jgi:hypothetical protein
MTDEHRNDGHAPREATREAEERRPIERAMRAYATFLRAVERHQHAVAQFRLVRDSHETLHGMLQTLAADRQAAAAGRLSVRAAVRAYVHRLRAEHRTPEVALRMTKRACRAIVTEIPGDETIRNSDPLLEETVRWAIEAYYEAA